MDSLQNQDVHSGRRGKHLATPQPDPLHRLWLVLLPVPIRLVLLFLLLLCFVLGAFLGARVPGFVAVLRLPIVVPIFPIHAVPFFLPVLVTPPVLRIRVIEPRVRADVKLPVIVHWSPPMIDHAVVQHELGLPRHLGIPVHLEPPDVDPHRPGGPLPLQSGHVPRARGRRARFPPRRRRGLPRRPGRRIVHPSRALVRALRLLQRRQPVHAAAPSEPLPQPLPALGRADLPLHDQQRRALPRRRGVARRGARPRGQPGANPPRGLHRGPRHCLPRVHRPPPRDVPAPVGRVERRQRRDAPRPGPDLCGGRHQREAPRPRRKDVRQGLPALATRLLGAAPRRAGAGPARRPELVPRAVSEAEPALYLLLDHGRVNGGKRRHERHSGLARAQAAPDRRGGQEVGRAGPDRLPAQLAGLLGRFRVAWQLPEDHAWRARRAPHHLRPARAPARGELRLPGGGLVGRQAVHPAGHAGARGLPRQVVHHRSRLRAGAADVPVGQAVKCAGEKDCTPFYRLFCRHPMAVSWTLISLLRGTAAVPSRTDPSLGLRGAAQLGVTQFAIHLPQHGCAVASE